MTDVRVYLEEGKTSVFAAAIDWPGWCRHAKGADQAVTLLEDYRDRYSSAVSRRVVGRLHVVGSVEGDRTTDFGAPNARGPWDHEPFSGAQRKRQIEILEQCWRFFDEVVASSSAALRKGPRGGGRDRDGVRAHVIEAERAYSPKVGVRVAPRTPWPDQRDLIVAGLRVNTETTWPVPYAIRRIAWHVLDHAWEIEDKRE